MTRILSKKEVEEWNQKYNKNVLTVMITLNKHKIKVIENGYFEYDVSETEIIEYLKKRWILSKVHNWVRNDKESVVSIKSAQKIIVEHWKW